MTDLPPQQGAGRFAPSPTSHLHLGNLRTALAAWLLARATGRRFIVRIEDLDQQRVAAARGLADQQLRDLDRLGLDWDGPVVRQSQRLDLYADAIASLPTYPCFCTRKEIAAASRAPNGLADWRPYPGTCRDLSDAARAERAGHRPPATRLASTVDSWTVTDLARGSCTGDVDDVVLRRNDGTPAYNLAVVVDDGLQGVDQVVRARDLWPSAPRQAHLASLLGYREPVYAHCGLVEAPGGDRLSKSAGAGGLDDLAAAGWPPGRVVALLSRSLGLPEVTDPHELLCDDLARALEPPSPSGPLASTPPASSAPGAPRPLDAGPLDGSPGWWSDWVPQEVFVAMRMSMT